ncbi:MAG: efflux RND transporter permease subunit [bacterium]
MKKLAEFVTRFPKLIVAAMVATTALFGYFATGIEIDSGFTSMIPEGHPARLYLERVRDTFGTSLDAMLIGIESDDTIFETRTLEAVARISEAIQSIPGVKEDGVTSLSTVDSIMGTEFGMEVSPLMERIPETGEEMEELRRRVYENSMYVGSLVSKDGKATLILARLERGLSEPQKYEIYRRAKEIAEAEREVARQEGRGDEFYVAGDPMILALISNYITSDMLKLSPIAILVVLLILYLSFRTLRGTLLPIAVVVASTVWTMGLMAIFDVPITIVGTAMPIMLIAVGSAYGIHVLNEYYRQMDGGLPIREGIVEALSHVGVPVMMAALTTMAGFSSLATSSLVAIRDFGVFASFGVGVASVFALIFVPATLALMVKPTRARVVPEGVPEGFERILRRLGAVAIERRWCIVAAGAIIVAVAIFGATHIIVDNNTIEYFKRGSEIRIANNRINSKFGGTCTVNAVIAVPKEGGLKDPKILKSIAGLQDELSRMPIVGYSLSLADYIKRMNRAMHEDDPAYNRIPDEVEVVEETDWVERDGEEVEVTRLVEVKGQDQIAQYLLMYESAGGGNLDEVVDYDYREANVVIQLKSFNISAMRDVVRSVEDYAKRNFPPGVEVNITGQYIQLVVVDLIVEGQIRSLIASILMVLIMLIVVFRSPAAGLLSVIPLTFTILFNFGLMWLTRTPLNAATAMIAGMGMGIGIDYSIHYISRYKAQFAETGNYKRATEAATAIAGKGIIYNASAVAAGFAVLTLSSFIPLISVGWLIPVTMVTTATGALTILPALLYVFKPRFLLRERMATLKSKENRPIETRCGPDIV